MPERRGAATCMGWRIVHDEYWLQVRMGLRQHHHLGEQVVEDQALELGRVHLRASIDEVEPRGNASLADEARNHESSRPGLTMLFPKLPLETATESLLLGLFDGNPNSAAVTSPAREAKKALVRPVDLCQTKSTELRQRLEGMSRGGYRDKSV